MIFFQEDDKGYEPARLEYYNNQRNWEAGEQVRLLYNSIFHHKMAISLKSAKVTFLGAKATMGVSNSLIF